MKELVRRPALGPHGRKVIAGLCTWEIVALLPNSPIPTISATVEKKRVFGVVLLALLGHHWFIEQHPEAYEVIKAGIESLGSN